MKKIKYCRQETEWWCGPACMQMALNCLGIKISQYEVARLMKTKKRGIGTKNKEMIRIVNKYKLISRVSKRKNIRKLRELISKRYIVIVNYHYEPENTGHFAIVKKISNTYIYLIDPQEGPSYKLPLKRFYKNWYGDEGDKGWLLALKR